MHVGHLHHWLVLSLYMHCLIAFMLEACYSACTSKCMPFCVINLTMADAIVGIACLCQKDVTMQYNDIVWPAYRPLYRHSHHTVLLHHLICMHSQGTLWQYLMIPDLNKQLTKQHVLSSSYFRDGGSCC